MGPFVDIHHHIVWDIDDGPSSIEASILMLHTAQLDGIRWLIATSHFVPGHNDTDRVAYAQKVDALNAVCRSNEWDLRVYEGAELYYTGDTAAYLKQGLVPTLAGSAYVLVEFGVDIDYEDLLLALCELNDAGFIPVVAHVERYSCLVQAPKRVDEIKGTLNLRIQVNCSSVIAGGGMRTRLFVRRLLRDGLVDYVATDAHNTSTRPVYMGACFDALHRKYGNDYARRLTGLNQMEIFGDTNQ